MAGLAHSTAGACLNCGADLHGAFCGACGQRSVPPDPTVTELAGDAWQELSGLDGRIAETIRGLFRPGRLTIDYLNGRRARYVSPVKLYLTVSVIYFLISAAAPNISTRADGELTGPAGLRIQGFGPVLTDEDRAELQKVLAESPWFVRPMLQSIATDPEAFRRRVIEIMPRVFFGMLPVFAVIVALFYRRRRFPTVLVFSVHLHALAFVILAMAELAKFSYSRPVAIAAALAAMVALSVYTLQAFRAVFGGSMTATILKTTGISIVYVLAAIPAFAIILIWASLT